MNTKKILTIYRPGKEFPAVSITGKRCDLMCEHCRGEHIKRMYPSDSSDKLLKKALEIKDNGGTGLLISGGCDIDGCVPVMSSLETIKKINRMGLEMNIHSGFVTMDEVSLLVNAGISRFSVDVHQDPDVIKNILHLDCGAKRYEETIDNIISAGGTAVPHITVGFGTSDLLLSMELLTRKGLFDVTLLVLVPTKNTSVSSAVPEDGVLSAVSMLLGNGFTVTLGCMRSRFYDELEIKSIELGVRRIANPSLKTIKWAKENGFDIVEIKKCCSF